MRIRCKSLLGDRVYPADLREVPSEVGQDATETVLVVYAGCDVELSPPAPDDCELIDANTDELASLRAAGFDLPRSS